MKIVGGQYIQFYFASNLNSAERLELAVRRIMCTTKVFLVCLLVVASK